MYISINRKELQKLVVSAANLASAKTPSVDLANVVLEVLEDGILRVFAADNTSKLLQTVQLEDYEAGKTSVLGETLKAVLAKIKEDVNITLRATETTLIIKALNVKFELPCFAFINVPNIENSNESSIEIAAKDLKFVIQQTGFCAPQNDIRTYLNGVCLSITQNSKVVEFVATDGCRLALCNAACDAEKIRENLQVILPFKAINYLRSKLEHDVNEHIIITFCNQAVVFAGGCWLLEVALLQGVFPEYSKILPNLEDGEYKEVVINRQDIKNALQRVMIVCFEKTNPISLSINNDMVTIHASSQSLGEAKETLTANSQVKEEICMNGGYLEEIITHLESTNIKMFIKNCFTAVVLIAEQQDRFVQYLLMPRRDV